MDGGGGVFLASSWCDDVAVLRPPTGSHGALWSLPTEYSGPRQRMDIGEPVRYIPRGPSSNPSLPQSHSVISHLTRH